MARQEQDFNQEINRQSTTLFIRDSVNVTLDLTEIQSAQVLEYLLVLSGWPGRLEPPEPGNAADRVRLDRPHRPPAAELQDAEINSLLQHQSIRIENCTGVKITVKQIELEKVVELALTMLRRRERPVAGQTPVERFVAGTVDPSAPGPSSSPRPG